MSERMSRLCDELRIKLHGIDRRLEALGSRLDRVEQRIYDNRVTVEAANVRVKAWRAEKRAKSIAGSPLWTERHKPRWLEAHADDAEAYAIAVFELAAAAADEATLAVLQALLARNDADCGSAGDGPVHPMSSQPRHVFPGSEAI